MINQESCRNPHLLLWAKSDPYKQLLAHMLDTGYCAMAFLSAPSSISALSFLTEQWQCEAKAALSFSAYLAALHDIGKAMPQFQRQDEIRFTEMKSAGMADLFPTIYAGPIEHEYFSARILQRVWKKEKQDRKLSRSYSRILSLHHQRIEKSESRLPVPAHWADMQDALEAEVCQIFNPPDRLPQPKCMDAVCIFLTGLMILCDWVSSSGPFDGCPVIEADNSYPGMETAKRALMQYGLISEELPPDVPGFSSVWPEILKPRDIQSLSTHLDASAPLTIIEAPMGEGKTEAALYLAERMRAAWGKRGIYVALPTQATSNQMYTRTLAMLNTIQAGRARLLHGTAFLHREAASVQSVDAPEAERWFSSLRMGLLDENGVGTVDQAMAGVLVSKFSVLRLLGLTNKVLIVDELHAYDAYMSEIIQSLLRWCKVLRIPVILLSATLQNSQRQAYLSSFVDAEPLPALSASYPLITQVDVSGHISEIKAEAAMTSAYTFQPVRFGEDCAAIAHHLPHTRGDEPLPKHTKFVELPSTPHAWG